MTAPTSGNNMKEDGTPNSAGNACKPAKEASGSLSKSRSLISRNVANRKPRMPVDNISNGDEVEKATKVLPDVAQGQSRRQAEAVDNMSPCLERDRVLETSPTIKTNLESF